jgi:outer membrane protein assembly factor BamE (lipoprotein component of BamABCDE complex)
MKKLLLSCLAAPLLLGNTSSDVFKDHDRSWNETPPVVSASVLGQLGLGMSRRQVRELIGTPHFNEGIMVKNWHYLVDISAEGQTIAKACQLRLDFVDGRVKQIRWEKPDCAEQI